MSESEGKYKKKKLGAWFPSATVIKANTSATSTNHESSIANSADSVGSSLGNGVGNSVTISLYYQYISPLWSESKKQDALSFVEKWGGELGIGGRLRIAREGINATISGNYEAVRSFNQKLQLFDSHFQSTDFKYIDNLPMDRAFKDLKVLPVKELVYYGISAEEELGPGGVHLLPSDYHKKLGEKDTVVIDVRNQYESAIGRFSKQLQANGAELLVPEMRKSTDFPQWISSESVRQKIAGKNVLMYCTGGVRCERASAYLKKECGEDIKGNHTKQTILFYTLCIPHHIDRGVLTM